MKLRCLNIVFVLFHLVLMQSFAQKYFAIQNLSVNTSEYDEYAPMFYKNDIVFVSNRKNDVFVTNTDLSDNSLSDIYLAKQRRPGKYGGTEIFSRDISTRYYEGPVTFNKDGTVMYFTRTIDVTKGFGNNLRGDSTYGIFSAELVNGHWTNITPLRFNKLNYNLGFPFLTEDGKMLFFCSEDPKGYGGFDIYVSKFENNMWSLPVNLGDKINTPKNELFPFYLSSGRLYFSSRGHDDKEDLDIFYSELIDNEWQEAVKLPVPFNSTADDFSYIINATMDTGFFASNRTQSRDIYIFTSTLPVFSNCPKQQENDYCFVFYEQGSIDLDTTTFRYEWDLGDGTKIRGLEANHCYAAPGTYTVKLNVIDTLTGEVYFSQAEYEHQVEKIEQVYITAPDTSLVTDDVKFNGNETYLKNFTIDNYYWDFGDGTRAEDMTATHKFDKPGTYTIQLGVTSQVENNRQVPEQRCVTKPLVILRRR